jgi:hypothetical protein
MMNHDTENTARTLVADGKGILAADETPGTLTRRFDRSGLGSPSKPAHVSGNALRGAGRCHLHQWRDHAGRDDQTKELPRDAGPASVEFEGQRPLIAGRGSSAHLSGACHETHIMTEQSGIGV